MLLKRKTREKDQSISDKSELEKALQFCGEHNKHHLYDRISPVLAAKHPADYTNSLIALWPFSLGILSNSLFGRMKPVFLFHPANTHTRTKIFFFFFSFFAPDVSVSFGESIIKASFLFPLSFPVSSCNLAVQPELMNINGWLSILFVQQQIQCCGGLKLWTIEWGISQFTTSAIQFNRLESIIINPHTPDAKWFPGSKGVQKSYNWGCEIFRC